MFSECCDPVAFLTSRAILGKVEYLKFLASVAVPKRVGPSPMRTNLSYLLLLSSYLSISSIHIGDI